MVEPSQDLQLVFDKAIKDAKKLYHEYVTLEHLLYAMLCEENFSNMLKEFGADIDFIKTNIEHQLKNNDGIKLAEPTKKYKPKKTHSVERVLNRAFTQVLFAGRTHIELKDVLISMLNEKKSIAVYYLNEGNVDKVRFAEYIADDTGVEDLGSPEALSDAKKALKSFTTNLNDEAKKGKIDPIIGRSDELESLALALGRRSKNNVLMVGDPGVGKTAIAEGLAYNIINNNVPEFLKEFAVFSLDIGAMLAGSKVQR